MIENRDALGLFFIGIILGAIFFCVVSALTVDHDYRRMMVACGKAHYDTTTGQFIEDRE